MQHFSSSLVVLFPLNLLFLHPCHSNENKVLVLDDVVYDTKSMTCSSNGGVSTFDGKIRGTCIGGWMVLEPWITPSLFYQFLGGESNTSALDSHSFCAVLGPEEGNKQLRRHWETWVTEEYIKELVEVGKVNSFRLPVGDWMYKPYWPYIGCYDGALEYVEKFLGWADKYDISVLIDLHAVQGSQNGFDNSGKAHGLEWVTKTQFAHWPVLKAEWIGEFDVSSQKYLSINYENINHTIEVIGTIADMYKNHSAVLGIEPLNEPWWNTPLDHLKRFYFDSYIIVKTKAKNWKFVIHDSFRFLTKEWEGFMSGCPDIAMDTHMYQAWWDPQSREAHYNDACFAGDKITKMEKAFGPVVVGEWSLATDTCAMWLNGFNDNQQGYPKLPCKYIPCAEPYMGRDQPGTPPDPSKPLQGPFGTGASGPVYGLCPVDRDWTKGVSWSEGTDWVTASPDAEESVDDTDEVMTKVGLKKLNSYSKGHGFYFWNFRTELYEPHWNYLEAVKRGWLSTKNFDDTSLVDACIPEEEGLYSCVVKKGVRDQDLCHQFKKVWSRDCDGLSGDNLFDEASTLYEEWYEKNKTCDFKGTATLITTKKAEKIELSLTFLAFLVASIALVFFVLKRKGKSLLAGESFPLVS